MQNHSSTVPSTTPAPISSYSLIQSPPPTELLALHTGRLSPLSPLKVLSGIDKSPRIGNVQLDLLGFESDEHDPTFHGGIDKAVHQYCFDHYAIWADEFPSARGTFQAGGFGENLIVARGAGESGWDEEGICIGDVIRVGWPRESGDDDAVLLEVSIPRQPCFKLTTRFGIKNFAAKTVEKGKTGWYYRVLRPGNVEKGMQLSVLKRRNPEWSIARVQDLIHRTPEKKPIERVLDMKELGKEARGMLQRRLRKIESKKEIRSWTRYKIVSKRKETKRVVRLVVERIVDSDCHPEGIPIDPGSHVKLKLPNGLQRAYSVVGGTNKRFSLAIALEPDSRGGSSYLHFAEVGSEISVSNFKSSVPKITSASHHIFIAGGIGITAFIAMVQGLEGIHYSYELHYAVRNSEDIACKELLHELKGDVRIYDKERLDLRRVLQERKWNSMVYVCGLGRMNEAVLDEARRLGIESEVHVEAFEVEIGGDAFAVEIDGKLLEVAEDKTLLEVLKEAGLEVDSSCEVGNCGSCKAKVLSGKVEHRGSGLSEEEKKDMLLSCVSRGMGTLVIQLMG
jgi:MOSC domain-containing protein YiiM/ferredoxin-NADP reductase